MKLIKTSFFPAIVEAVQLFLNNEFKDKNGMTMIQRIIKDFKSTETDATQWLSQVQYAHNVHFQISRMMVRQACTALGKC